MFVLYRVHYYFRKYCNNAKNWYNYKNLYVSNTTSSSTGIYDLQEPLHNAMRQSFGKISSVNYGFSARQIKGIYFWSLCIQSYNWRTAPVETPPQFL